MLPSMDKLPLDLWDDIFRHACTDGGRTGAALARTSSFLRAASAPYRFYSLKFTNLAQIGRFLLCLDRIERAQAPHAGVRDQRSVNTRHMLLSFFPDDCESLDRQWRGWSEYSSRKSKRQQQLAEDERAWHATKGAWDRQFLFLVPHLLRLVAPTLETLVVLQQPGIPLPYVKVDLFALRELSLLADDRMFVRPDPRWEAHPPTRGGEFDDFDARVPASFPSLTHLHIVYESGAKQHSWEKTLPLWAALAPALTHLRVSQASNLIPEVLEAMSTRVVPRGARGTPEFRAALAHPRLRKIIIQPLVLQPVKGHDFREEARLASQAPRGSRIVVLRGRWYRHGYWRDRLKWEWEDRMIGKAGCWAESEDDEGEWTHERRKRAEVAAQKASKMQAGKVPGQSKDWIRLDNPERMFRSLSGSFLRRGGAKCHGRAVSV